MLKQQMSQPWKLFKDNEVNNEELEQYGRRLCFRTDGILKSIKSILSGKSGYPSSCCRLCSYNWTNYLDKSSIKNCKSIMLCSLHYSKKQCFRDPERS